MSDEAHFAWAIVAFNALMVVLVIGCTAVVAYFTGTAAGLVSLVVPLCIEVELGPRDPKQDPQ